MPTEPGPHDVGEAEGDSADDRGAAVGSHDEHAGAGGGVLERHLVLDGHVVGEDHDADAGRDRVERLDDGVRTGHRDEREVGPDGADGRARRARGGRLAEAPGGCGPAPTGQRLLDDRQRRGDALVAAAHGDEQVVGRALGHLEAHAPDDVEVELRRHRDLCRVDARGGRGGTRDLHEAHGVDVGAGAALDVVRHGGLPRVAAVGSGSSEWARASRAPDTPESRSRPDV